MASGPQQLDLTGVEGSIASLPTPGRSLNALSSTHTTLDEPVSDTIIRDLRKVAFKLKFVLVPYSEVGENKLRDWDLWGPLLLNLILSM